MDELSTLRFEINLSKLSLIRALDDRNEDLKKLVADAMDRAIPEIKKQIDMSILKAVSNAVDQMVEEAADSALEQLSEETAKKLSGAIEKAMRNRFTG